VVNTLPVATRLAHPKIGESLKATAQMTMGNYVEARAVLEESLQILEQPQHQHALAVCLGRLSLLAHRQGDFAAADDFNKRSKAAYHAEGSAHGVLTCCHNGTEFALMRGDIDTAVEYGCEGIQIAARRGDVTAVVSMYFMLAEQVIPLLGTPVQITFPENGLGFPALMEQVATAAQARDLGSLTGLVSQTIRRFGPGGISNI